MSKYSDEPGIQINKADLAKEQLEDAIDSFLPRKRISVITLAGAADGIFSGLLKQKVNRLLPKKHGKKLKKNAREPE